MMKKLLIHTSKYTMKFLVRIIIISTFFLFSCDEISEIGINEILTDQHNKIKVEYVEIPLETSNVYYDSVRTDDGELLFGKYNDPIFGETKAIAYTQFTSTITDVQQPNQVSENWWLDLPNDSSILDSAVLYLKISSYHGTNFIDEQEVYLSQIADTIFSTGLYLSKRLTEISPSNKGLLGLTRFVGRPNVDTARISISIKENYAKFLLNRIAEGASERELINQIRGWALIPGDNNSIIIGFDLLDELSKVVLYYKNPYEIGDSPVKDSLEYVFRFDSPLITHYSYFETNRENSVLSNINSLEKNEIFNIGDDKIYWQSGTGIYPIIDLSNFYSFIDTAGSIVLNKVQLTMGPIEDNNLNYITPPDKAIYYFANSNNGINSTEIYSNPTNNAILKDNAYYGENVENAEYVYDSLFTKSYLGSSTIFFQEIIQGNINPKKLVVFPDVVSSFNQATIDKNSFILRIFYTDYKE